MLFGLSNILTWFEKCINMRLAKMLKILGYLMNTLI